MSEVIPPTLKEVRELATQVKKGNSTNGSHFLLGYIWEFLDDAQKIMVKSSIELGIKEEG